MSQLNKSIIIVLLISISFVFGQVYQNEYESDISFRDAVNAYNNSEYFETKYFLDNLSFSESQHYAEEITVLRMKTEYQLDNFSESISIGKSFLSEYPKSEYLTDVLITYGDIFHAENNFESAYRSYLKALKQNYTSRDFNKITKRIIQTLQFGISENVIDELLSFEDDTDIITVLLLSKAQSEIQNGKFGLVRETLEEIDSRSLSGTLINFYNQLSDKSDSEIRNVIVPVVLPFSGKNAKIGREFLEGLNFARSQSKSHRLNLTFIVYNNESDELKTLEIFNKISKNQKTVAVLGPIADENIYIAGSFAAQCGIPILLPNTMIGGLADISDYTFLMNSDIKTRGESAARFIAENINAQNIAVLAPADKYGKSIVDAFEIELKKYGLSTAIVEWYSGTPMNLERQFSAFRIKAWELADSTDTFFQDDINTTINTTETYDSMVDSLLAVFKEEVMTKDDSAKVVLESIDAIYIPIRSGELEYVGAQFPVYNLKTKVIGNDNWTDLNILQKESIGSHFKDMIVITNYSLYDINRLNNFVDEKHTEYFYQAVDAYNLLVDTISDSKDLNVSLKRILSEIINYKGVFGSYNFAVKNNVNTNLKIVQFNGRGFVDYEEPNNQYSY